MSKVLGFFAERVKAARQIRGMFQADLAKAIGTDQRVISEIEKGNRDVRLTTIKRLAAALRVSVEWLLKEESVSEEFLTGQTDKLKEEKPPFVRTERRGKKQAAQK